MPLDEVPRRDEGIGDGGAEVIAGRRGVRKEADRNNPDASPPRTGLLGIGAPGPFRSNGLFSDDLEWLCAETLGSGLGRLEERAWAPFRMAAPTDG